MRTATIERKTNETQIKIEINLDGKGDARVATGLPFLDHMFTLFAKHGLFDLEISCQGDLEIDAHHTIEDLGIAFGEALNKALGDKNGINRYGWCFLPMDETLVRVVVDFSNRPFLVYHVNPPEQNVANLPSRLFHEFFYALTMNARINLHIEMLYSGENHHLFEAIFKGLAKAIKQAVEKNPRISGVLSTKGTL